MERGVRERTACDEDIFVSVLMHQCMKWLLWGETSFCSQTASCHNPITFPFPPCPVVLSPSTLFKYHRTPDSLVCMRAGIGTRKYTRAHTHTISLQPHNPNPWNIHRNKVFTPAKSLSQGQPTVRCNGIQTDNRRSEKRKTSTNKNTLQLD